MRDPIHITVERDIEHPTTYMIVYRDEHGSVSILASHLKKQEAARMLLPIRTAFMKGAGWMREDVSNYALSSRPNIKLTAEDLNV